MMTEKAAEPKPEPVATNQASMVENASEELTNCVQQKKPAIMQPIVKLDRISNEVSICSSYHLHMSSSFAFVVLNENH